jgi:RNA polymerase sigma-70 factor (ECF subfamily)
MEPVVPVMFAVISQETDMSETHLATINSSSASILPAEIASARSVVFEELFSRHYAALYKIALRILGNSADAEDALQDALLSAFRHFDQFKGEARISTWLTTIVLNSARMQLRRRSRRRFVSLDAHDDESFAMSEMLPDAGPNPEQAQQRAQLTDVLEKFAVKLPKKIRPAFRLRVLEGLTTREAAERMGVSEGKLKAQFFRACRRITPLLRDVLVSPAKSKKRSRTGDVRVFVPQAVAISAERSKFRRVA